MIRNSNKTRVKKDLMVLTSCGPLRSSLTRFTTTGRMMARHSGRKNSWLCAMEVRAAILKLLSLPVGTLVTIAVSAVLSSKMKRAL